MSNEFHIEEPVLTGRTLYARVIRLADIYVWNGTAFEARAVADGANYAVAMTETPAGLGQFIGSFPTGITTAAVYSVEFCLCDGATPSIADTILYQSSIQWDGTAEESVVAVKSLQPDVKPIVDSIGSTHAISVAGYDLALARVQPDNKPTVDSSGNTRAVDSSGNVLPAKTDVVAIEAAETAKPILY